MKNLEVSEKSKGVLIFANNTGYIDYTTIAQRAEILVEHYLKLPVTIVTGQDLINHRYNIDSGKFEAWHNGGRYLAHELSPYDQTILIDGDYFVFDDNLLKILDVVSDYQITKTNNYVCSQHSNQMGQYSLDTLWATVMVFNKTPKTKMLFDLVGVIERNYQYYRDLYNIEARNFRNDYAFTIADNIINGYSSDSKNYLPWPIVSVPSTIDSLELRGSKFYLKTAGQAFVLPKQSIHLMSKAWILSDECQRLIEAATHA
jgi:hypothetical protein